MAGIFTGERARNIRSVLVLPVVVLMIGVIFFDRYKNSEARHDLTIQMNHASWLVSELLYDAGETSAAFQDYADGRGNYDTVQHLVDVLKHNVDSFEGSGHGHHEHVKEGMKTPLDSELVHIVKDVQHWLHQVHPQVLSVTSMEPAQILELKAQLKTLVRGVHDSWTETHMKDSRGLVAKAMDAVHSHDMRLDLILLGCVIFQLLYFIVELRGSNRAQKRESALKQAAMEGSRTKTNFLSNISHEIRTPLNGILGMVEGLKDTPLSSDQMDAVTVIEKSSSVLLNTFSNVLEIAQLEAGTSVLKEIPFNLPHLVEDVGDIFKEYAQEKRLTLTVSCDPDVPTYVMGDPYRFATMARHLVSNAIKYTSYGEVKLKLSCQTGEDRNTPVIMFEVEDTGIGIEDEHSNRIFEPFHQVGDTMTRNFTGVGLGLALARQICWIMGGKLELTSRLGEGSCFTCCVPMRIASEDALAERESQEVIRRSVVAALKSSAEFNEDAKTAANEASSPIVVSKDLKDLKVLIVDDSRTNRMVLKRLLNDASVTLFEAENGATAVSGFQDNEFDVVLMDIQMPVLNGIEAVRRIRQLEVEEGRKKSKIYAVTANILPQQMKEYFDVGMDDVLAKPIKKNDILDRIYKVAV